MPRRLIVNADDFGLTGGINSGIAACHENGILTSTSLMVRQTAAKDAAQYARVHPRLSVGLHVDLGEWEYRDGDWRSVYQVVSQSDRQAVEVEIRRQMDLFCRLVGSSPTHLDSHQHVHLDGPAKVILTAIATELGVPLRNVTPGIGYCGAFYGQSGKGDSYPQAISPDALIRVFESLPMGVTELACHPGDDPSLASVYCRERAIEVATLCDPAVKNAIERLEIELCSFKTFR